MASGHADVFGCLRVINASLTEQGKIGIINHWIGRAACAEAPKSVSLETMKAAIALMGRTLLRFHDPVAQMNGAFVREMGIEPIGKPAKRQADMMSLSAMVVIISRARLRGRYRF